MDHLVTIYLQGHNASRLQATKYAGKEGLDVQVSNGQVEHVFKPDAPRLLYNLFTYPELNDLQYGWSWHPVHWLSMLVHWLIQWYLNIYGTSCVPHNLWSRVNVAGDEDVAQCLLAIKSCIRENPQKGIVLFGASRGGATVLVTLPHLSKEELSHIKLVIVEAPFTSLSSLLYERWPIRVVPFILSALEYFTQYRTSQVSPLEAVTSPSFPLATPLVFVTSDADNVVPLRNTQQLITVLKERAHSSLSHIALKYSGHSFMSIGDTSDAQLYESELHTLYRKVAPSL